MFIESNDFKVKEKNSYINLDNVNSIKIKNGLTIGGFDIIKSKIIFKFNDSKVVWKFNNNYDVNFNVRKLSNQIDNFNHKISLIDSSLRMIESNLSNISSEMTYLVQK